MASSSPGTDPRSTPPPPDASATVTSYSSGSPLRLWPALLLVALLWGLHGAPVLFSEPSPAVLMLGFVGPCAIAVLILLWWLLFSRATLKERLLGSVGLVGVFAVARALAHETVAGVVMIALGVPWGVTAFVAGAVLARRLEPLGRTAMALLAALVGFGYWDLVRTDAFYGDFTMVRSWRWEATSDDRFQEARAARTSSGATGETVEQLAAPQWSGFRGLDRRGEQPGVVLAPDWASQPPREVWRVRVGAGWSSFSVAGDRLFTQEQRGEQEAVVCYSARDGSELWEHRDATRFWETIGGAGPRGTPTIAGRALYTVGASGLVHRLEPLTGGVVWTRDLRTDAGREPPEWGFSSSPLVTGGLVIVYAGGGGEKGLLAYAEEDGALRWSAPAGDHSYSSPQRSVVDGRDCILQLTNAGLGYVDPVSGAVLGEHAWPCEYYRVLQPLVLDGSSLLLGTPVGVGTRRLDVRWDGERFVSETRWTSKAMKPYYNDFVLHKGALYGFDNNIFACVDAASGERRWKKGRYGNGQVLLLPSGDQLLVMSERGELVLLRADPERSVELARHQVLEGRTWNHPVVVGNRMYVRNGEEAVCLEVAVKLEE